MLKKPITYVNYDGIQRTENYWFNLDEAEILELQMRYPGGMSAMLQKMVEEEDGAKILATIKEIIMLAYGEKSLDGKYFEKSPEKSRLFTQSRAYSALLMELYRDAGAAADFMNKIIPQVDNQPAGNPNLNVVAAQ
jgi:hypothetical protein